MPDDLRTGAIEVLADLARTANTEQVRLDAAQAILMHVPPEIGATTPASGGPAAESADA